MIEQERDAPGAHNPAPKSRDLWHLRQWRAREAGDSLRPDSR